MTPPRSYADIRRTRMHGEDKFGKFRITGGPCTNCGAGDNLCITYGFNGAPINLPKSVLAKDTILTFGDAHDRARQDGTDAHLGINCGCYAKFHRQVAHIEDKVRSRS